MTLGLNFKLIDNWVEVIKYAYSFLFSVSSALMASVAAMLQFFPKDSSEFAFLTSTLTLLAAVLAGLSAFSRVWHQKNVTNVGRLK
jgi:uncharacterized protein YozE (UPF0346 family)